MNVFLTGATGFVGSALLARYLADGFAVRALVRQRSNRLPVELDQVVGDLSDLARLEGNPSALPPDDIQLALHGVDVVVHPQRGHILCAMRRMIL